MKQEFVITQSGVTFTFKVNVAEKPHKHPYTTATTPLDVDRVRHLLSDKPLRRPPRNRLSDPKS